ncbi:MAG: BPL-N domain-containing protein [Sandaracinaceae bacterium]
MRRPAIALCLALSCFTVAAIAQPSAPLRVAIYEAAGVAPSAIETARAAMEADGMQVAIVTPEDVRGGALDRADAVLFTGGRGSVQGRLLGDDGRERVRRFVANGGGYVGICAGSYLAMQGEPEFYKIAIVAAEQSTGDRWLRGIRPLPVRPSDGSPEVTLHYANGPLLAPTRVRGLTPFVTLATFAAEVHRSEYGTLPGEMLGAPAVAAARYRQGRLLLFSPNPTLDPGHPALFARGVRWAAAGGAVPRDLRWRDVFGEGADESASEPATPAGR